MPGSTALRRVELYISAAVASGANLKPSHPYTVPLWLGGGPNPMPCGGIHPIDNGQLGTIRKHLDPTQGGCWVCSRGGAMHFCHEWDTFIHARCVPRFLETDEGQAVIEHRHTILLDFSLEEDSGPHSSGEAGQSSP